MIDKPRRKYFFWVLAWIAAAIALPVLLPLKKGKKMLGAIGSKASTSMNNDVSDVFWVKNGNPAENVRKAIDMMGGIERFINKNDIVVLKPNAQWWNQGRTNLWAMKGVIDNILEIPGFSGEVIIAENNHFMNNDFPEGEEDNVRGWVKISEINGDIEGKNHSLNSLVEMFNNNGYSNVTKVHWRDGGPKHDVWGNGQNGGIVHSPGEGDGYVWSDIDYIYSMYFGIKKWPVKMTYPIFTSTYSGFTIDFKNGIYLRDGKGSGEYVNDRLLKFINFAVLNDHGKDTGITSSIKNYMGIIDMSCGAWGINPSGYYNFHQCGEGRAPFAKAGPIGHFMRTIRKADLNIVTAEWVGWGHRTDVKRAKQMNSILTSTDPVALDYIGAKDLIYPLSKNSELHDPDNPNSPIFKFLKLTMNALGSGVMDKNRILLHDNDLSV